MNWLKKKICKLLKKVKLVRVYWGYDWLSLLSNYALYKDSKKADLGIKCYASTAVILLLLLIFLYTETFAEFCFVVVYFLAPIVVLTPMLRTMYSLKELLKSFNSNKVSFTLLRFLVRFPLELVVILYKLVRHKFIYVPSAFIISLTILSLMSELMSMFFSTIVHFEIPFYETNLGLGCFWIVISFFSYAVSNILVSYYEEYLQKKFNFMISKEYFRMLIIVACSVAICIVFFFLLVGYVNDHTKSKSDTKQLVEELVINILKENKLISKNDITQSNDESNVVSNYPLLNASLGYIKLRSWVYLCFISIIYMTMLHSLQFIYNKKSSR